ncbi:hydrolase [Halobacillus shinanisalinarum]|uniref:Hydrolase n=1 Tax=Halobacillus shinanisalinarum TaxID=2932258 RepID=A0ABY4H1L8_9BACI|nr:hydrolase [Halobacillus shinanisalinarum]UOQ94201.1 hydrolase [Halobacillus shinanisalinarum]
MEKNQYYVNIGTREISINHDGNNDEFMINADREELLLLREVFNEMYNSDTRAFFRSHVPFEEYHKDSSNDEYDEGMMRAFQMLYDLGDEKTRQHISGMGVLKDLN